MIIQLATRIDEKIKKAIEDTCKQFGIKMNRFIEEALLDKLEEFIDAKEINKLKKEPTRSFDLVVKDLQAHGKI